MILFSVCMVQGLPLLKTNEFCQVFLKNVFGTSGVHSGIVDNAISPVEVEALNSFICIQSETSSTIAHSLFCTREQAFTPHRRCRDGEDVEGNASEGWIHVRVLL